MKQELINKLHELDYWPSVDYRHINETFDLALLSRKLKLLVKLNCNRNSVAPFGKEHTVMRIREGVPAAIVALNIKRMVEAR